MLTCISLASIAQGLHYHPEFYFDKMSPNGKWLATHTMGIIYIYGSDDSTYREYLASDDLVSEYYATGLGNCWSNTGILVGSVSDSECAYWQNDEWYELPIKDENQGLNLANGITPDGSRIVGQVGISSLNLYSEQMIKPVYWDCSEDGSYSMYKELPYPAKDFCGRTPQYVTAISVSDDGKTIVGQIVDWSGWYSYPIIYTQDSNGEWSYKTIDEDVLYPKGAEFGTWPGEEPSKPNHETFMTADELAAFTEAYNQYMEAYNNYLMGIITWDEVPAEPNPADYIVEQYNEYIAAMNEYNRLLQEYYQNANAFDKNLSSIMYGYSFSFNNVHLSGNGKYYNTTMNHIDTNTGKKIYTPVRIDLTNNYEILKINGNGNMLASSVMNDGRMIVQTPPMAYARNSFVVSEDGNTMTSFVDYMTSINSYVGNWVKEMSTFDVLYAESYDEFGNPNIAIAEDSIVSGSVHCNSDGTIFTSFMYDEWSESVGINFVRQFSYQIDFTEDTGIEGIDSDVNTRQVYVADNTLYVSDDVTLVTIYNLQGAIVTSYNQPDNRIRLDLPSGIYMVKTVSNNIHQVNKIVVQ